ncbi:MAG: hypothetical protein J6C95_02250 [Muribaculaceae bacterium]|nr:hypothetical protein [Muribaculaceae bacterium]
MNTPLITWAAVVALISLIAVLRIGISLKHRCHIFEIGNEREEIFIPGDPLPENDDDYDED